jgi:hypothetical protein
MSEDTTDDDPAVDASLLQFHATDAGWRLGRLGFQPDVPLHVVALRAPERARTYVRRTSLSLTPRQQVCVAWTFAENYVGGVLQAAWCWAHTHEDPALTEAVDVYARATDWLP